MCDNVMNNTHRFNIHSETSETNNSICLIISQKIFKLLRNTLNKEKNKIGQIKTVNKAINLA